MVRRIVSMLVEGASDVPRDRANGARSCASRGSATDVRSGTNLSIQLLQDLVEARLLMLDARRHAAAEARAARRSRCRESKAAASVIMPASRTMATGARFCPSSSSIVLSNGARGVRAGVDVDRLRRAARRARPGAASRRPCDRSRRRPRRSRGRARLSFMPSTSQRTMRCLSPSSRKCARIALSMHVAGRARRRRCACRRRARRRRRRRRARRRRGST